jgi:uncharacterized protein
MKALIGPGLGRQVAFVGPFGVGKTTAVFSLCGGSVAGTDVRRSMPAERRGRHVKQTTTVGLEVGRWTAPDGEPVTVVGTPGQERFDLVRRSAMPRSAGVVLWVFGHHKQADLDVRLWLEFIGEDVSREKMTVAVTRIDEGELSRVRQLRETIAGFHPAIPMLILDPRSTDDVATAVTTALRLPSSLVAAK